MKIFVVMERLHCMTSHRIPAGFYIEKAEARQHARQINALEKGKGAEGYIKPRATVRGLEVREKFDPDVGEWTV